MSGRVGLLMVLLAGCRPSGDGAARQLALGFQPAERPLAVGVQLQLAVERPRRGDHFCIAHCELDPLLDPIRLQVVGSSRPDILQVVAVDAGDTRAPLITVRAAAAGQAVLSVEATAGGRVRRDRWTFTVRPLARVEVTPARLPENARVQLQLRPVDAEGRDLYAGAWIASLDGAARLAADDRIALDVETGAAGPATLLVRGPAATRLIPLEVGDSRQALR